MNNINPYFKSIRGSPFTEAAYDDPEDSKHPNFNQEYSFLDPLFTQQYNNNCDIVTKETPIALYPNAITYDKSDDIPNARNSDLKIETLIENQAIKKTAKPKKERCEKPKNAEKIPKKTQKKKNKDVKEEESNQQDISDAIFMDEEKRVKRQDILKTEDKMKIEYQIKIEQIDSLDVPDDANSASSLPKKFDEINAVIQKLINQDEMYKVSTDEVKGCQMIYSIVESDLMDPLKDIIEQKASMSASKEKTISQIRSYANKNLQKKIGDTLCDYIIDKKYIITAKSEEIKENLKEIKEKLKDTLSWKKLNNYLLGNEVLCPEIDPKHFRSIFKNFVINYDVESLEKSKTKDEISKYCYKIVMKGLKKVFEKLDTLDVEIEEFKIKKAWPAIHLVCFTNSKN